MTLSLSSRGLEALSLCCSPPLLFLSSTGTVLVILSLSSVVGGGGGDLDGGARVLVGERELLENREAGDNRFDGGLVGGGGGGLIGGRLTDIRVHRATSRVERESKASGFTCFNNSTGIFHVVRPVMLLM